MPEETVQNSPASMSRGDAGGGQSFEARRAGLCQVISECEILGMVTVIFTQSWLGAGSGGWGDLSLQPSPTTSQLLSLRSVPYSLCFFLSCVG